MSEPVRTSTDPRIRSRRNAVARSRRRRYLVGGVAVLVVGLGVWGAYASPLLNVRTVKVVGVEHTTSTAVIAAAGLEDDHPNVLTLSTSEIEVDVARLPWVKEVEVDRMLPGTVRIRVTERTPSLVLSLGAAHWTIDRQGHVLEAGAVIEGLPVLAGIEVGKVQPGIQLKTPEARAALKSYRALLPKVRRRVDGVFAPTVERITFSLDDGTVIRFGADEQIDAKNEVLAALLARLQREGREVAYIDVRVPTSPAISEVTAVTATDSATPAPTSTPVASPTPSPSPSASTP
jgi:cell division protein FtsQ